jgi:[methyl-Co(III) methanol-specific corrinoid protein]:coenzyme M methyltransferase
MRGSVKAPLKNEDYMLKLTPQERVIRFFQRKPVDIMPCFSGMGMVTIQIIDEMNICFADVHTSAENLASSAKLTAETYGYDAIVIPYDMCTVPEALGCGANLYEDSNEILYPTVPDKWEKIDDVIIPDDFLTQGRLPLVDEAFHILISENHGAFALGAWVLGPFTMAGQIVELNPLLKGVRKEPERTQAFLDKMTDLVLKLALHYQALGVDYLNIREMGTGSDLLSPKVWETLIGPNLKKIFDKIEIPTVNHICGSTDLIIEMMNACGADAISVDQKNNLIESRKKIGDDVLLLGNFDPYGTLVTGDLDDVEPVIKKCIEDGVDAVWPGCDIWPEAKKENVAAYVQAVREYGQKSSPAVGRL